MVRSQTIEIIKTRNSFFLMKNNQTIILLEIMMKEKIKIKMKVKIVMTQTNKIWSLENSNNI